MEWPAHLSIVGGGGVSEITILPFFQKIRIFLGFTNSVSMGSWYQSGTKT